MADNDEFSIDFSKVIGLFKKKKKAAKLKEKGIKENIEAGVEESSKEKPHSEAEVSFQLRDIRRIWNFIVRNKTVFLILIPIIFAVFLRSQTFYLPVTDVWAENTVKNYYASQIANQIDAQYPNLPMQNKQAMVQKELDNFIKAHETEYKEQVKQLSHNFKQHFKDETGQTYLLEIDTYQWFRHGKNILDHGYIGDKKINGVAYDMHMLAPLGKPVGKEINPYVGAYLYRIIGPITGLSLMGVFFIIPIIVSALAVIPAFFIGRRLMGNFAGFATAFIVAVHPALVTRTMGGFSDTDPYNVFFPLMVFWLFIETFEAKSLLKKSIYASLMGICIGLFAFAWYGWWFIFDFAVGAICIYILYHIIKVLYKRYKSDEKRNTGNLIKEMFSEDIKHSFIILLLFLAFSFISILVFANPNVLKYPLTEPIASIALKEAAKESLWPNVYTTVAEMNAASISTIISTMGGKILFIFALVGVFLILLRKKEKSIGYFSLLALWFFGSIYACTKGIRFTVLLTPAFAIAVGIAFELIYEKVSRWSSKELHIGEKIAKTILIVVLLAMLFPITSAAYNAAVNEVPLINDAWVSALTKIKQQSSENAIINSWWDFGHWFKAWADRPVTFDGGSQNVPQAHWIGKVLLTADEEEAIGILRMLDCGANTAFDVLYNYTNDTEDSVDMLYKIIKMEKEDAKNYLLNYVPEQKADEVLKYTHCIPPENFFITSEDMVGKAAVWAHFGSWDFDRSKIWRVYRKMDMNAAVPLMMKDFNYTKEQAEKLYYEVQTISGEDEANTWIAPWPGYLSTAECKETSNSTAMCIFNIQNQQWPFELNLSEMDASMETTKGAMRPYSLVYAEGNIFREKRMNNTIPYSMAFITNNNGMKAVLMSPELAGSMFTRLFYFNGTGLKHFDYFDYERDLTGLEIYTWKINWEGKE